MDRDGLFDRVKELERVVLGDANAHEGRLVSILISVNGASLALAFTAVASGKICVMWTFVLVALLFVLGAALAFLALAMSYWANAGYSGELAKWVMAEIESRGDANATSKLASSIEQDEIAENVGRMNNRYKPFTWLVAASAFAWFFGIFAAIILSAAPQVICAGAGTV